MRRASNSYEYGHDVRYNTRSTNRVTLEQLFNAIDAYKGKDPDTKVATKEIDHILSENASLLYETDDGGNTALIHACRRRMHPRYRGIWLRQGPEITVINTLLHYGSDSNARNKEGKTALHYACQYEPRSSKVRDLYETIAKIDDEQKRVMTRVIRKLIKAGGDLRLHDNFNKLPIDYAREIRPSRFRNEMIKYLTLQKDDFSRCLESHIHPAGSLKGLKERKSSISFKQIMGRLPDYTLDQPRLKFTGYGIVLDKTGGKIGGFGEAASIPYISQNTLFDQKGEQKIRFRLLNFIMSRRVWRGTPVTYLAREDTEEDGNVDDYLNAEIQKNAPFRHPNLLMIMSLVHDISTSLVKGIVYERVELGTLKHLIKIGQYFDCEEWIPLMTQITDAVEFLNESGIIHQAIVPEAIMIMSSRCAKLGMLCFGRPEKDKSYNWESTRIPDRLHRYIAPEVLRNEQPTKSADTFSLSAVIYELMVGRAPWAEHSVKKIGEVGDAILGPEVEPEELQATVRFGLQRDLKERKTRLIDIIYVLGNLKSMYQNLRAEMDSKGSFTTTTSVFSKRRQTIMDSPSSKGSRPSLVSSRRAVSTKSHLINRKDDHGMRRGSSLRRFEELSCQTNYDMWLDMNRNPTIEQFEKSQPYHLQYETKCQASEPPLSYRSDAATEPRMDKFLQEQLETSIEHRKISMTDIGATPERAPHDRINNLAKNNSLFSGTFQPNEYTAVRVELDQCRSHIEQTENALDYIENQQDSFTTAKEALDETPLMKEDPPQPIRKSTSLMRIRRNSDAATEPSEECIFKKPLAPPARPSKPPQIMKTQSTTSRDWGVDLMQHFERISRCELPNLENLEKESTDELEDVQDSPKLAHDRTFDVPTLGKNVKILASTQSSTSTTDSAAPSTSGLDVAKLIIDRTIDRAVITSSEDEEGFDDATTTGSLEEDQESIEPPTNRTLEWEYDEFVTEKLGGLDLNQKVIFGTGNPVTEYGEFPSDFVAPELVDAKNKMRDTSQIPKIVVHQATPELPKLKPTQSLVSQMPKPFVKEEKTQSFTALLPGPGLQQPRFNTNMDIVKTPSRLSFPEKLAKFKAADRAYSEHIAPPAVPVPSVSTIEEDDQPTPLSIVTSTPAVDRIYQTELEDFASDLLNESFDLATVSPVEDDEELSTPFRDAEEIKSMLDHAHQEALGHADRREILEKCRQHETFSQSVVHDGISYDEENLNATIHIGRITE